MTNQPYRTEGAYAPEPWDDAKIREAFIYDGGESEYHDPINGAREQRRIAGGIFDRWLAAHDEAVRAEERERIVADLIGPAVNLAASVKAFKTGWHDADMRGLEGERVASGLRHVVNARIRELAKEQDRG